MAIKNKYNSNLLLLINNTSTVFAKHLRAYFHDPCARAGPILTSLRAGCKINFISSEFTVSIATPQIVCKRWLVVLQITVIL